MSQNKSPIKGTATDRLTLKRKAMATLTAVRRSEKSRGAGKICKKAVSDGELLKRKVKNSIESDIDTDIDVVAIDDNDDSESRDVVVDGSDIDVETSNMVGDGVCSLFDYCKLKTNVSVKYSKCFDCYNNNDVDSVDADIVCKNVGKATTKNDPVNAMARSFEKSKIDMKNNDKLVVKCKNDLKKSEITAMKPLICPDRQQETIETKVKSVPDAETDTAFVSSLFNPLSSDLDEPVEISVLEEVSLDDSIDIDDLLNYREMDGFGVITPLDMNQVLSDTLEQDRQVDNRNISNEFDLNNNKVVKEEIDIPNDTKAKHNRNIKTSQQADNNNNTMFKPAFNSSPKPIFGAIVELASSISPKKKIASDPILITKDHSYSKTKKPVHFTLKSRSLKCTDAQSASFTGIQCLSSSEICKCNSQRGINSNCQEKEKTENAITAKETKLVTDGNQKNTKKRNAYFLEKLRQVNEEAHGIDISINKSVRKGSEWDFQDEILDSGLSTKYSESAIIVPLSIKNDYSRPSRLHDSEARIEDSCLLSSVKNKSDENKYGSENELDINQSRELRRRKDVQVVWLFMNVWCSCSYERCYIFHFC